MMRRLIFPMLHRLKVGRFQDWYRFTWARLRSGGRLQADAVPTINPPFTVRMAADARMRIGRGVVFRAGFSAYIDENGVLEIGDRVAINTNVWIGCRTRVTVGDDSKLGPMVVIVDGNHRFEDPNTLVARQGYDAHPVDIGRDVVIGAHATVLNHVGSRAFVGANSVVVHPIPADAVAVGAPAKPIRVRGDRRTP